MSLRYAVVLPGGSAPEQVELAVQAERAGWDGVFVFETAYGVDAWSLLAAMAVATSRVRLGTMLTPLPWRRPWKLASQVATVDQLSGGRVTLGVGVGAVIDLHLAGDATDLRERASMLDEGIDLIRALWAGERAFQGRHYDYRSDRDDPAESCRPVQERVPIWVVGVWPRPKSMGRVLRCDGIIPQGATVTDYPAMRAWLTERGARPDLDVLAEGETPAGDQAAAIVTPWAEAGCTWWMETRWQPPADGEDRLREIRDRITAGPPRVRP